MKRVRISHSNKVIYTKPIITKKEVIEYYRKIQKWLLPCIKGYPIVMQRFPQGIESEGFYQKRASSYFPQWIEKKKVLLKQGGSRNFVLINTERSLLYLVNQGMLVIHRWLSTSESLKRPDKIVFDLDPSGDLSNLRFIARALKSILEENHLVPFIMTTGSRGYHVVVPIEKKYTFTQTRAFAKVIAYKMSTLYPDKVTIELSKKKRKGKIFLDYLRNGYGQTAVAPYSLRAIQGAPVATPIAWKELNRINPQTYTIKNIFKRISHLPEDPWKEFKKSAKKLPKIKI